MQVRLLLCFLACCLIGNASASDQDSGHTLYLVRHAEKQSDGSHDPALNDAGKKRSMQLAILLQDKDIKTIWSSDFKRTRETAKPLLSSLVLQLNIYDPRNQADLVENLLENQQNTLIVGHSNTIPELARLICDCLIADMNESEYDRMIVISIIDGEVELKTLQQDHWLNVGG